MPRAIGKINGCEGAGLPVVAESAGRIWLEFRGDEQGWAGLAVATWVTAGVSFEAKPGLRVGVAHGGPIRAAP